MQQGFKMAVLWRSWLLTESLAHYNSHLKLSTEPASDSSVQTSFDSSTFSPVLNITTVPSVSFPYSSQFSKKGDNVFMLWGSISNFDGWALRLLCFSVQQTAYKRPSLIWRSSWTHWILSSTGLRLLENTACCLCHLSIRDAFVLKAWYLSPAVFFSLGFMCLLNIPFPRETNPQPCLA
jgi:hypothetical protein